MLGTGKYYINDTAASWQRHMSTVVTWQWKG